MKHFSRVRKLIAIGSLAWFVILGCQTGNLVARGNPTITKTAAPTIRATFTRVPPPQPPPPPPPVIALPPTAPPTRAPTARPLPTRTRTPIPPPAAPPPTPDPDAGWYYKRVFKGCSTSASPNTRFEGTVYENGVKKNGVLVRLSHGEHLDPLIPDFVTGVNPNDHKHIAPEREGMYRLSPAEGGYMDGNWWIFVIGPDGAPLSKGQYIKTHDVPGCNVAILDFVH